MKMTLFQPFLQTVDNVDGTKTMTGYTSITTLTTPTGSDEQSTRCQPKFCELVVFSCSEKRTFGHPTFVTTHFKKFTTGNGVFFCLS